MENRCGQVLGFDAAFEWKTALSIRLAVYDPATDTATGKCNGKDVPPVIATGTWVDAWRATKLAHTDD